MGQNVVSIRLDPADGTVAVGSAVQLNLHGATGKGETRLIPANVAQWTSSAAAVAAVSRQGKLSPLRAGRVTVTAQWSGLSASAEFVVVAAATSDGH